MDELPARLAVDLDNTFPEVVKGLQAEVYSGLRQLTGTEAEDLTQETFIRAYYALSGYDQQRIKDLRLRGWIWTIALNLGRNHRRDMSRRPLPVGDPGEVGIEDPEPPDRLAWERRLRHLSGPIRRAVVLRHVVGLDYEEISVALARPVGTVKADVHRGIRRLRQIMEDET
ncbi:MAG: RNA polymerase sigma factor [Actinomycetota bacterium]